ncbi:hypothetical protein OIU77_025737 [Salix suchowensis]|uniref:Uncharacterized protein n=2 Tax=Salix TaxID=40685 RepID=A0A9Q0TC96_9ROSI|nr:hypothetical protein OIU77_025737 [Salix suchowensis]KAJ6709189.1 hypothetical protein OIU74_010316 [Salix koriyanagi]
MFIESRMSFFVVSWIICLRCWLRACWLCFEDQSGELIDFKALHIPES